MLLEVEAQADIKNYCEPVGGITSGAFDQRARWFIIPLNNGFGRYMFVDRPFYLLIPNSPKLTVVASLTLQTRSSP